MLGGFRRLAPSAATPITAYTSLHQAQAGNYAILPEAGGRRLSGPPMGIVALNRILLIASPE